jgi:hypothetical protein
VRLFHEHIYILFFYKRNVNDRRADGNGCQRGNNDSHKTSEQLRDYTATQRSPTECSAHLEQKIVLIPMERMLIMADTGDGELEFDFVNENSDHT